MKQITFLGLGNFGYALLKHFDVKNDGKYKMSGWDRSEEVIRSLQTRQKHPFLFPTIEISDSIFFSSNIEECIKDSTFIIFAIASPAYSLVLQKIKDILPKDCVLINTAKALEYETGKRFSVITKEILGDKPYDYAMIAGGTIASDLFKKEPLGADIACEDGKKLDELVKLFNSYNLSVYPTPDISGVEYASAFKNIVSILAGIIKGIGYSYGSETHVISRAAYEIEQLVVTQLGGKKETFSIGSQCWGNDLWMSSTGKTRNKEFGELIGKGLSIEQALSKMEEDGKTVEGIQTIKVLKTLANLKQYPLLSYLDDFFNNHGDLKLIEKIIFNHEA